MDDLFTSNLNIKEKEFSSLSGDELRLSPKESTIEFIRNFARNFRVAKNVEPSLQGFVLN
ncbi:MAG: hypothetical protein E7089_03955 [Bacteroidales bacterium]|nr:hypothetical protein [Bacteroidales bacterium]MBR2606908.1 hypothetical protein [Bacteroidaceae bacterium]